MSDKFMFFRNFKQIADGLPDDLRLQFYDAMCAYVFDEIEPDNPIIASLVQAIKPSLEKHQNWGGARNGAGRPKQIQDEKLENQDNQDEKLEKKEKSSFSSLLETETETETETEVEVGIGARETNPQIAPPDLETVFAYAKQQNSFAGCGGFKCSRTTAEEFWAKYSANGWREGNDARTPIVDWHAKLRQWVIKQKRFEPQDDDSVPDGPKPFEGQTAC